ncbi:MAG: beta-N-acetylhexosaminidase [Clostridia bacterium]|nr:beta-N-acetylhexosaminidase [Clostridia bacterium]
MANRFGVMLDMSRNAVMKPEEIKRMATLLHSFGYNMIQLYTEDTYEVEGEPYIGYLRGRYTKEELRDVVSYCNSIGVEIIPCIQTLAHLNQIFHWNTYREIRDADDILMVGEKRTYELIERMIKTLRECFTTDIIHVGMDEAHMLGLGKYLEKHGFRNRFDIIHEHLERVLEIAKKYGFRPIMWSDMFFRLVNSGEYFATEDLITDEVVASCPEGVDIVYWDYYHNDKKVYDNMLASHKKFRGETWFAGGAWTWSGFAPVNSWTIESMTPAMQSCAEQNIENIFLTMWGDNGKETSFYSALPALYAVRRIYDGVSDMDVIKKEFYELTGERFDEMMALDLPDVLGGVCQRDTNPSKHMLYNDPFGGFMDSTAKPYAPAEYAEHAKLLASYAKNSKKYAYIFESEAALCDLMSVKYDLGVRTRAAYQAGDKQALAALCDDYALASEKLETFYRAFFKLWHTENKPFGFDVQELRLGGLAMRLRSCRERLLAYVNGEVDVIEELAEVILPFNRLYPSGDEYLGLLGIDTSTDQIAALNKWSLNASASAI